jgi:hypothetical protein
MKRIRAEVLSGFEKCADANMSRVFCIIFGVETLPQVSNHAKTKVGLSLSRHLETIGGSFRHTIELPRSTIIEAAQRGAQNDDAELLSKPPEEKVRVPSKQHGSTYDVLWERLRRPPVITSEQRRDRNRVLTLRLAEVRSELCLALLHDADALVRAAQLMISKMVSADKASRPFRLLDGTANLPSPVVETIDGLIGGTPLKARAIVQARGEVARRINPDRGVETYFLEVTTLKREFPPTHLDKAREKIQELRTVKEQLFDNNLPLILNILGRQKDSESTADEVFPAVQYAIDTFDPTLGFEFSTRLIDTCKYLLRAPQLSGVPMELNDEQIGLLVRIREAKIQEPNLTAEEIARRWEVGIPTTTALLALSNRSRVELDKPYEEGESGPQIAGDGLSPIEAAEQLEEQRLLRSAINKLRDEYSLYAQILELRNGPTPEGPLTPDEIGQREAITLQRKPES